MRLSRFGPIDEHLNTIEQYKIEQEQFVVRTHFVVLFVAALWYIKPLLSRPLLLIYLEFFGLC